MEKLELLSSFGKTIAARNDLTLDGSIKDILSYKPLLARIFKISISECSEMSYEEIEKCIEGEIEVGVIPVDPGLTNAAERISGQHQEDSRAGEGTVTYDIRTFLRLPQNDDSEGDIIGVKILVDVEAQKDDTPGYDIATRALFYCCRMVSSQLGVEFSNNKSDRHKYAGIKKVYSIWICTETSQKKANTIERYSIKREVMPGSKMFKAPRYDVMEAVIINISKNHDVEDTEYEVIRLLTDLFNNEIETGIKIEKLKGYGLPVTAEYEKEVADMTAYAARLITEGIEKGLAQGRAKEIFASVEEGDYSAARGAEKLGMSLDDFFKAMTEAGYTVPREE